MCQRILFKKEINKYQGYKVGCKTFVLPRFITNPDVKKNEKLPFGSSFVSLVECIKPSVSYFKKFINEKVKTIFEK